MAETESVRETISSAYDKASGSSTHDYSDPKTRYLLYLDAIAKYEREFKKWEGRTEKIIKKYRDEGRENRSNAQSRFNILWSNVQTLVPACFSKLPQPDVSRRFKDNDTVGRVASLILERALDFEIQHYTDYRNTLTSCVYDRFLGGRGTAWIRYEPHFKKKKAGDEDVQVTDVEEADTAATEQLDYECAPIDYVHWKDFGHSVARTWDEVCYVWRKVYLNEEAVKERFGEKLAAQIPYDQSPDDLRRTTRSAQENWKQQAVIYEFWDKNEGCAVWLSKSYKEFLDERDDPLGLQEFFPCPMPLYGTITNETLVPIPDYTQYQDQAIGLDIVADRLDGLTKQLQLKGTYDAGTPELRRLFTEGENGSLIPVQNFAAFAEKGGLKGGVDLLDLTMLAEAIKIAAETQELLKNQIYDLTGISDIVRGSESEHQETATEQTVKGQYASLRLKAMQEQVAQFATDILQLKAQIMCSHFEPKTIAAIAAVDQLAGVDQQAIPEAMALLVGEERLQNPDAEAPNPLRSFRVEVNADTLVQLDENQQKADAVELLNGTANYFKNVAPIIQMAPASGQLFLELAKFAVTKFKAGKAIEGVFDQAIDQIKQVAQQPPPPDPKAAVEQAKLQVVQQKGAIDIGVAKAKAGIEMQKMQEKQQMDRQQMQIDAQRAQQEMAIDQQRMGMESQMAQQDMAMQQQQHVMDQKAMQEQGRMQQEQNRMKLEHADAQHRQKMKQVAMRPPARRQ